MHWMDGSKKEATSELKKKKIIVVHSTRPRYYVGSIPSNLQLARANVEIWVFIAKGAELDILGLICIPKPKLGTLVETFFYVAYIP